MPEVVRHSGLFLRGWRVNPFSSVRAREHNVFSRGSAPVTRLTNALQMLGKRYADPYRSVGDGVALINERRFMSYSLAFQGIKFASLWTREVSPENGFGTALEHQIGPFSGIRGNGLGEKQLNDRYVTSWEKPVFESPFERRRLRILNSLFFAVGKMNGRPTVCSREARGIAISFFQQHLQLTLDKPKRTNRRAQVLNTAEEVSDTRLCLSSRRSWGLKKYWPLGKMMMLRNSKRA